MRPQTLESLQESFDRWMAHITDDGDQRRSARAAEITRDILRKKTALESFIYLFGYTGFGLTLKHVENESWAMVLMDASEPGRVRWQEFKPYGFISHQTWDSVEECLSDMIDSGYLRHDPDALERLCVTPQWQEGMEVTSIIQAANNGRLEWIEAIRRIKALKVHYLHKEAA